MPRGDRAAKLWALCCDLLRCHLEALPSLPDGLADEEADECLLGVGEVTSRGVGGVGCVNISGAA